MRSYGIEQANLDQEMRLNRMCGGGDGGCFDLNGDGACSMGNYGGFQYLDGRPIGFIDNGERTYTEKGRKIFNEYMEKHGSNVRINENGQVGTIHTEKRKSELGSQYAKVYKTKANGEVEILEWADVMVDVQVFKPFEDLGQDNRQGGGLNAAGMGLSFGGFVASAGEYSHVINGYWRGANGQWHSLSWGGNQWTGKRADALIRAGTFKGASRVLFVAGAVVSFYQGLDAINKGNNAGAAKSGVDVIMGYVGTFGGPPGWLISGGYFALDAFDTFDRPNISTPNAPIYAFPDKTYVSPPYFIRP